jgi:type II secretory pathway pseudopilin PulG
MSSNLAKAMTLVEVIVVTVVVFILALIILPSLTPARPRASGINCVSNLKQIGLAFRMWSGDHGEKFPWQVSMSETGTLEFAESPAAYRHFLAVSNELSSPKVLACSTDKKVLRQPDWSKLNNAHLSYFVGLEANEANPQTILSGDRNITGGALDTNGIMGFDTLSAAGFGPDLHNHAGNIGLGDGSAQQTTDNSFRKQIQSALQSTNVAALRFSIPKPK